jgi:hypothetical protein
MALAKVVQKLTESSRETYNGKLLIRYNTDVVKSIYDINVAPGLYDINDNLLADWNTLTNTYGLMLDKDYSKSSSDSNYYKDTRGSGFCVFHDNSALPSGTTLVTPDNLTYIGTYSLEGCDRLKYIMLSSSITSLENGRAYPGIGDYRNWAGIYVNRSNTQYKSVNDVLYSGDGTTLITYPCKRPYSTLVIPHGVTSISSYAFYESTSITSIEIPDSVTSIGMYAFYYCTSLTSIVIPDSVTSIGSSAFSRCSSLTSIEIPDSVTSISNLAFSSCTSLTSIVIPNSVTSTDVYAFQGCSNLANIYVPWAEGEVAGAPWGATNATVHYNYKG